MQPDLRERLEAAATENGRSLNAEITERLIASFEPKGPENWSEEFVSKALVKALERINSLEENLTEMVKSGDNASVVKILAKQGKTIGGEVNEKIEQSDAKPKSSIEFTGLHPRGGGDKKKAKS